MDQIGRPTLHKREDQCDVGTVTCDDGGCCSFGSVCCRAPPGMSDGFCCTNGSSCALVNNAVPTCEKPTSSAGQTTFPTSTFLSTTSSTTTSGTNPTITILVPQSDNGGGMNNSAWIAGPIIGSLFGFALVVLCCILYVRHRKRQNGRKIAENADSRVYSPDPAAATSKEQIRFEKPELEDYRVFPGTRGSIHEAPSKDALPHELYGDHALELP